MSVSLPDLPFGIPSRRSRAFIDLPAPERFMMSLWTTDEMWEGAPHMQFGGNGTYGSIKVHGRAFSAQAYAWHLAFGLPDEYFEPGRKWEVHHRCPDKYCVFIPHLELLSTADHHTEHRRTMCKKGLHPLVEPDDWYCKDGRRLCKECAKKYNREKYHALSAEEKRRRSVANTERERIKRNANRG